MTRTRYRVLPGLARRAARRDPAKALERFLLARRLGVVSGLGFTAYNGIRGAWGWLALTVVLLALEVVRLRRAQGDPDHLLATAAADHALAVAHQDAPGAVERLMATAGAALGIRTDQAYTVVLATIVALLLLVTGLPGALRGTEPVQAAPSAVAPPLSSATPRPPGAPRVPGPVATGVPAPGLPLRPPATFAPAPVAVLLPVPGLVTRSPRASPAKTLTVLAASWATADPVAAASATVPAGGLPVEARGGQVSKVSFLRLRGTARQLRLGLSAGATDNLLVDSAAILACRIVTVGWAANPGQPLSEAPAYDCSTGAVDLVKQPDGTWVVPLESIPTVNGEWSFALVPAGSAGAVFRVTFHRPTDI